MRWSADGFQLDKSHCVVVMPMAVPELQDEFECRA